MDMIGNTPEINDHQNHYVSWLATPSESRDPTTEIGLARRFGVDRTKLWRWRRDPFLSVPEMVVAISRDQLVSR
jgi:hypothetical protein